MDMIDYDETPCAADAFCNHEILDRSFLIMEMWDGYVANHPAIHNHEELDKLAESISTLMSNFYQQAGNLFIGE